MFIALENVVGVIVYKYCQKFILNLTISTGKPNEVGKRVKISFFYLQSGQNLSSEILQLRQFLGLYLNTRALYTVVSDANLTKMQYSRVLKQCQSDSQSSPMHMWLLTQKVENPPKTALFGPKGRFSRIKPRASFKETTIIIEIFFVQFKF